MSVESDCEPRPFFTDSVRELSLDIIAASEDVLTINDEAVETVLLPGLRKFQTESKDAENHFKEESLSPENELGLNLYMDVINFCFQNPYTKTSYVFTGRDGKTFPRSIGLKTAMKDSGVNWGDNSAVAAIKPSYWNEMIQLSENYDFYLGAQRGLRVIQFAKHLLDDGFPDTTSMLGSLNYDADYILRYLSISGFFEDEFQKRSQLVVNVVDKVLRRTSDKFIKNADSLTVMADYRLPQLMYNQGAIILSDGLKGKLMHQVVIASGSREERALRAASVVIGERLAKLLGITEGQTDSLLWSLAVDIGLNGKFEIPHMLVPTDKY